MPAIFLSWVGSLWAFSPQGEALADRILLSTLSTQYEQALRQADTLVLEDSAVGGFFQAMIRISRYDDLGDTLDLDSSKEILEGHVWSEPFWESLRRFQLGYIQTVTGHTLSAALTTRKAAQGFAKISLLDAQGFYAIYEYYLEDVTSWIPFQTDRRPELLKVLDSAARQSRWFGSLFSTSLVWMLFDRKDFVEALTIVDALLLRYPEHPVFLQMRADMLFRLRRYPEAAALYLQSAENYSKRAPGSVRWWSAAGNLVRIYYAMGDSSAMRLWQKPFGEARFTRIRPWMPQSLLESLEKANMIPSE
ncbi:MAG TPA: tetratricopeptide repeat protein [Fibrobacteraceae bacterium]|nr:tetratricopeptide repeat protein [Fibrobacteraceae bacterium]